MLGGGGPDDIRAKSPNLYSKRSMLPSQVRPRESRDVLQIAEEAKAGSCVFLGVGPRAEKAEVGVMFSL